MIFKFFKKIRVGVDGFFEKYFTFYNGRIKIEISDFILFLGFLFVMLYSYIKLNVIFFYI